MSSTHIAVWVGAAVLLFWTVGAYNRLVRLRHTIRQQFTPVDEQFQRRQALLLQQLTALAPLRGEDSPLLVALRAACQQAEVAHARARIHPGATRATTSMRLAEDILADTRARVLAAAPADDTLTELNTRLAASDATLAFARRQFNDAVEEYNLAVRQFPTWLIASLFSFRTAGTL